MRYRYALFTLSFLLACSFSVNASDRLVRRAKLTESDGTVERRLRQFRGDGWRHDRGWRRDRECRSELRRGRSLCFREAGEWLAQHDANRQVNGIGRGRVRRVRPRRTFSSNPRAVGRTLHSFRRSLQRSTGKPKILSASFLSVAIIS